MRDDSFEKLLDFLLWNEENAKIICSFIDDLTADGFEYYISEYYKKIQGFTTTVTGGFDDKWIDVKGLRIDKKWEREHLIIQCKKWNWGPKWVRDKYYIWENLIAQFYGKVADHRNSWNIRLVYATTKDVTPGAKVFCKDKNIDLITFKELVDFNAKMNLKEWIESILESPLPQIKKEEFISKEYIEKRRLFLQEKQEINNEVKKELLIEKSKYTSYDRCATFEWSKIFIKNPNNSNISLEEATYNKPKKKHHILLGIFVISFFWLLLIVIISYIWSNLRNTIVEPMRNSQINSIQNTTENIIPNKKRNIPRKHIP